MGRDARSLPADLFAWFAAKDLVRWRALRGCAVAPSRADWGEGLVTDVRWEARSNLPEGPGVVHLRVEYADGLRARVNSDAFSRLHRSVQVEGPLADAIERWFGADGSDPGGARDAALAELDRSLREQQDSARSRRVEEMRSRAERR
jgi:hypothetical protein